MLELMLWARTKKNSVRLSALKGKNKYFELSRFAIKYHELFILSSYRTKTVYSHNKTNNNKIKSAKQTTVYRMGLYGIINIFKKVIRKTK